MLINRDIICFSSIDWDFNWQGHQEIMRRLASAGNRVLFVENTGVRSPRPSDFNRMRERLANWWHSYRGFRRIQDNLYVFSPLVLPFPHSRLARWINRHLMTRVLNSWFRSQRFNDPLIWTFLPSALTLEVIEKIPHRLLIYYCIDSFRHSSPAAGKIIASETEMIRRADLVLVTSDKLAEYCREGNSEVHKFPFTVNYDAFAAVRDDPAAGIPEELNDIPGSKAGYIGGLHRWIDIELIAGLADALPDVQFVMIGPEQTPMPLLKERPNIHLLGAREHADLPRYLKFFDIGLIPYRLTDYTQYVHPTKLDEYLAMGLPVISTDINEMISFAAEHPGAAEVGSGVEEIAGLIRAKLSELDSPREVELRRKRIEIASGNSWNNSLERICDLVERKLDQVRPSYDTGWLERLMTVSRSGRKKFAAVCAVLAVIWLMVYIAPSVRWLGAPLVTTDSLKTSDVILVFGGGVGETGQPGSSTFERAGFASELYTSGIARKVVFSSGYQQLSRIDAEDMLRVASTEGLKPEDAILESGAANNYENVRNCVEIMASRGFRSAVIVTGRYNARRTRLLLYTQLASIGANWASPDSFRIVHPPESVFFNPSGSRIAQLEAIIHEYGAIAVYWWRGWI